MFYLQRLHPSFIVDRRFSVNHTLVWTRFLIIVDSKMSGCQAFDLTITL